MKTALLLFLFIGLSFARGQGTIRFTNVGLDAPVRTATGELVPAGFAYTAELLAGPDATSLSPVQGTDWFSSPGCFGRLESVRVLDGFPPGSHPWFMVRCWRLMPGLVIYPRQQTFLEIGESMVFQLDLAGPGLGETADDAPELRGMMQFQLRQTFSLSVRTEARNVVVHWESLGWPVPPLDLERATSINGPWQVLTSEVSPYLEPLSSEGPVFFRIVVLSPWLQANQPVEATQPRLDVSDDQ